MRKPYLDDDYQGIEAILSKSSAIAFLDEDAIR
jgi:hypothetical protein